MTQFSAEVLWLRSEQNFLDNRYNRKHTLRFDCGLEIAGSSSPHIVPPPYSDTFAVDPEEAFVASLASCRMLWFLSIAAKRGFCVDRYFDSATGIMEQNNVGKLFVSVVTLCPLVSFSGEKLPSRHEIDQLHHHAHAECFIANSVKTEIRCQPIYHS